MTYDNTCSFVVSSMMIFLNIIRFISKIFLMLSYIYLTEFQYVYPLFLSFSSFFLYFCVVILISSLLPRTPIPFLSVFGH